MAVLGGGRFLMSEVPLYTHRFGGGVLGVGGSEGLGGWEGEVGGAGGV